MNVVVVKTMEKKNNILPALERAVFPVLLFLFPLLLINQGIDITDTTYSLGNYRFMEQMDRTWVLATYLANIAGSMLMKLPFGDTLLGMNLYTGLIVSFLSILCYYKLKKWIPACLVFAGEMTALGLCWSPTTALYHYMTYFFFTAGSIFLYQALTEDKKRYYVIAGICLGLNVMVRFPNVTEAALILAVWYAGWLNREKLAEIFRKTGYCLAGYAAGAGSILLVIMIKYGTGAFGEMIGGLFGMTQEASDYTLFGMLSLIGSAYLRGFMWIAYMLPCIAAGMILFYIGKGKWERAKKVLYIAGIAILLKFYWGQGMYSFRYYNEGSIFQWMMLFLILTILLCVADIGGFLSKDGKIRILAAVILIIVAVTPIGSNNYTYSNMNNLFLAAPYTFWACWRLWHKTRGKILHFPWQAFMITILAMTFIQGIGFGATFVFKDGINGEKRDTRTEGSYVLEGMYTTRENAQSLSSLAAFMNAENPDSEPVLIWGDAPGLSYILDMPCAIFTTWPEAPSNTYAALDEALTELSLEPIIIWRDGGSIYEPDKELSEEEITLERKRDLIADFIASHKYECIFENDEYRVFNRNGENND